MTTPLEQLRELAGKATQDPLDDDGEYFSESGFDDLTKCSHGETGRYQNRHDGKLIAALWNNLPTILTALELQERLDKAGCIQSYGEQCANAALEKAAETAQSLYCDGDISSRDRTAYVIAKFIRNLDPAQIVKEMNHD